MRNYVKFLIGLDYDPNSAGGPPNVLATFLDDNDAAGFTGQLHPVYCVLNKALVMALVAQIAPQVVDQMLQIAQDGMPSSKASVFEFNLASPKEWWSNGL